MLKLGATDHGDENAPATVELFELNGTTYSIPAKPKAHLSVRYLFQVRDLGEDVASANLLASVLGEDGFRALSDYEDLTPDDFKQIMEAVKEVVMGGQENAMGNGGRGRRK